MIMPATPCIALGMMLTSDGINPYKKPSNTKYPSTITASAAIALISFDTKSPSFLCSNPNIKKAVIAISPFIIKVAGA